MGFINFVLIVLQAPLTFVSDITALLVWRRVLSEDQFKEYEKHKIAAYKVIEDSYAERDN